MARALVDAEKAARTRAHMAHLRAEGSPTPFVTVLTCNQLAGEVGAASCGIVTQVSGAVEGCECRVIGSSKFEFPDTLKEAPFKLTGVAPSIPTTAGGKSVVLCTYFQWLPPHDSSALTATAREVSKKNVERMVQEANTYAQGNAGVRADWMWAFTPTPFPRTPPPAGCTEGRAPTSLAISACLTCAVLRRTGLRATGSCRAAWPAARPSGGSSTPGRSPRSSCRSSSTTPSNR